MATVHPVLELRIKRGLPLAREVLLLLVKKKKFKSASLEVVESFRTSALPTSWLKR